MKKCLLVGILVLLQIAFTRPVAAADFDWLNNLQVRAEADASGFNLSLASRFHIGDLEIKAVLGQVERGGDAYMIFRLAELSHHPYTHVLEIYQNNKQQGWGKMAKELGIKPGSNEFHQLKKGHDLDSDKGEPKGKNHKNEKKNKKPRNELGHPSMNLQ